MGTATSKTTAAKQLKLKPGDLKLHPVVELFPEMTADEYAAFRESVQAFGISDPVWVDDQHQVVDGRHRLRAAQDLGLDTIPARRVGDRFLTTEAEIRDFVVAQNLNRRHLSESQRAMVAAALATAKKGRQKKGAKSQTIDASAEAMHVSPRSVAAAKKVREHGVKELVKLVDEGKVAVSLAAEVVDLLDAKEQRKLAKIGDPAKNYRAVVWEVKTFAAIDAALDAAASEFAAAGWQRCDKEFRKDFADFQWFARIMYDPEDSGWRINYPAEQAFSSDGPDELFATPAQAIDAVEQYVASQAALEEPAAEKAAAPPDSSEESPEYGQSAAREVTEGEKQYLADHGYALDEEFLNNMDAAATTVDDAGPAPDLYESLCRIIDLSRALPLDEETWKSGHLTEEQVKELRAALPLQLDKLDEIETHLAHLADSFA